MSTTRKPLVAGNWKMNGSLDQLGEIKTIAENAGDISKAVSLMICPPFPFICDAVRLADKSDLIIGAQDCHPNQKGAHTGDVSADMLVELGAGAIIVGHSERRADHGEASALVAEKAAATIGAGSVAIICIGETEAERDAGKTLEIVSEQLAASMPEAANAENTVIAYEPVWAIGTGRTPTVEDIAAVHLSIRTQLNQRLGPHEGEKLRILYGGSVKPSNAADLMAVVNVDGALVGGASLKAADFLAISGVYA